MQSLASHEWRSDDHPVDIIEAKDKEIATGKRLLAEQMQLTNERTEVAIKYRMLCNQLGEALEEAVYSNSTKKSQELSDSVLAAWRNSK